MEVKWERFIFRVKDGNSKLCENKKVSFFLIRTKTKI